MSSPRRAARIIAVGLSAIVWVLGFAVGVFLSTSDQSVPVDVHWSVLLPPFDSRTQLLFRILIQNLAVVAALLLGSLSFGVVTAVVAWLNAVHMSLLLVDVARALGRDVLVAHLLPHIGIELAAFLVATVGGLNGAALLILRLTSPSAKSVTLCGFLRTVVQAGLPAATLVGAGAVVEAYLSVPASCWPCN